ncbi:MAG: O-antigen ligase family protein [Bacteroidota bacterium]
MKIGLSNINNKLDELFITAISVSVFLPIKFSSIIIILALSHTCYKGHLLTRLKQLRANKFAVIVLGFFVLQIISALTSTNLTEGLAVLERRLAFVLFPFLLVQNWPVESVKRICLSFVVVCNIALLYCVSFALISFYHIQNSSVFFYHNLSQAIQLNAIYFSIYCVFSLFVLLVYFNHIPGKYKYVVYAACTFLATGILLLSSKNLLFVLLVGAVAIIMKQSVNQYRKKLAIACLLLAVLAGFFIKPIRNRFMLEFNANMQVVNMQQFRYDTPFTGLTLRLVIWKNCIEILNEKKAWIQGVGIGDFQDLINEKYRAKGIYSGNKELGDTGYIGYGPHNQWVEMLLSTGIIGLLTFVLAIIILIKKVLNDKTILPLLFLFIFISVSFTECVLSTNKGIIYFMFFMFLFSMQNCKILEQPTEN